MSRPIKEEDTGKPRQIRVDRRTFMRLLVARDMMAGDMGLDTLHLGQVIQVLVSKYIEEVNLEEKRGSHEPERDR
jgi:hypothetical protein